MTVKSFYPDVRVTDTQVYYMMINPMGDEQMITRKFAAEISNAPDFPLGWKVERRLSTQKVPGCPWCGVRPMLFERDCDGWASMGTCGSQQCNRLRRCEGCGADDSVRYSSVRGRLCTTCHETARRDNLVAADTVYALISWAEYYGEAA